MAGELDNVEHKAKKLDKGKWLLVVIGVVTLIIIYRAYKSNQGGSGATSGSAIPNIASGQIPQIAQSAPTNPTSGSSMPDFSSLTQSLQSFEGLVSELQNITGQMPAGTTAGTAPSGSVPGSTAYTSLTGEKLSGSGYTPPLNTSGQQQLKITTAQGSWYGITSPATAAGLQASGVGTWWQSAPGVFTQNKGGLAAGTSLYQKIG